MSDEVRGYELENSPLNTLKRAIVIGFYSTGADRALCLSYLEELKRLCDTFGLEVVEEVPCPLKQIEGATYIGSGKIEELQESIAKNQAQVLIFDDEISPHQQRNLEEALKVSVIDRTELILEVFARHAQTREAKLQIELARIRYQLPRLKRLWTHLSRQTAGGKGFTKGEGEKQIELDKRLLKKRITVLQQELKEMVLKRQTQRAARIRAGVPTFAIVGYTNVGKSTLLKALTSANVLVEDKLFATLDTTTRKFVLPNRQEILLVDTVGFIRKIPHTLVAAFRSTLEEALHTDVLIHVIDVSNPLAESQAEESINVLKELKAMNHPMITVLNKVDLCTQPALVRKLQIKFPKTVILSATKKEGFEDLLDLITKEIASLRKRVKLRIPQSDYALVSELMKEGKVYQIEYEENDVLIEVDIPKIWESKVKPYELASVAP